MLLSFFKMLVIDMYNNSNDTFPIREIFLDDRDHSCVYARGINHRLVRPLLGAPVECQTPQNMNKYVNKLHVFQSGHR